MRNFKLDIAELSADLQLIRQIGSLPGVVTGIAQDSREVQPGYIFASRTGSSVSGMSFVADAIERGATMILTDEALPSDLKIPAIQIRDFRQALIILSLMIYDNPSIRLKLIGLTGTNGKTTTTFMIRAIAAAAGIRCGLLGTVGYDTGSEIKNAPLTTPDIDQVCRLLIEMIDNELNWTVMEVSSHALVQNRVDGLSFAAAGFTNLTRDHLDYHGSFEEYAAAKARLFEMMDADGPAVINKGDSWYKTIVKAARGHLVTYGPPESEPDLVTELIKHDLSGGTFRLTVRSGSWLSDVMQETYTPHDDVIDGDRSYSFDVKTPLIGVYHGENIALAAGLCLALGATPDDVINGVGSLSIVSGRMEAVDVGQPFTVLVDYSHTPDALERALKSLRPMCEGKLILVFGCGGNRDSSKRPQMGQVAGMLADRVFITSDNPRFEDPEEIIAEIVQGFPTRHQANLTVEEDRRGAICLALEMADKGDIVLLSGKGHETYQEINGIRRDFDDREVARDALRVKGLDTIVETAQN